MREFKLSCLFQQMIANLKEKAALFLNFPLSLAMFLE
jgi:hypothetical protein